MKRALFLLCLVPLALTACASDKKPPRQCPQVAILRDLDRVEDYGNDTPDPSTLVSVAALRRVDGGCRYDEKGVDVNFKLTMAAEKGPRLGGDKVSFPFFVSLIDPEDKVVRKELMTAAFEFPSGQKYVETSEDLHVFIPLAEDQEASAYRILSGFQLSEAQLKILQQR